MRRFFHKPRNKDGSEVRRLLICSVSLFACLPFFLSLLGLFRSFLSLLVTRSFRCVFAVVAFLCLIISVRHVMFSRHDVHESFFPSEATRAEVTSEEGCNDSRGEEKSNRPPPAAPHHKQTTEPATPPHHRHLPIQTFTHLLLYLFVPPSARPPRPPRRIYTSSSPSRLPTAHLLHRTAHSLSCPSGLVWVWVWVWGRYRPWLT